MKSENETPSEEALDKLLRTWQVRTPLPPRFQDGVWQRIARDERPVSETLWVKLGHLAESLLPRPKVAYAYIIALLLVGGAAGTWAAQAKNNRMDEALRVRYLQTLDPFRSDVSRP